MAQQDIRYYLNGMLLVLDGEQMRVVATDGHRLSYASGTVAQAGRKARSHPAAQGGARARAGCSATATSRSTSSLCEPGASSASATIELTTKIIDGKFPDYTRVIPTNYQKHIALDRMLLLQSLQRAAILSNEKFRGVRWMLTGNSLRISCTNNEQEEAQEELEIDYPGEAAGRRFQHHLPAGRAQQRRTASSIDCAFGDANSSMLITLPDRSDYRYVVMPMRI